MHKFLEHEGRDANNVGRFARIEAPIIHDALAVVKCAAELQGRGMAIFWLPRLGWRTTEETQIIRLSVDDQLRFANAIVPPHRRMPR